MEAQIKKMKVSELKKELTKAGLGTTVLIASGLKAELVSRLLKHRQQTESKNEGADTAETANGKNKRKAEETEEDKNVLKRSKSKNGSQPLLKRSGSVYEVDTSYVRVREGPPDAALMKLVDEEKNLVLNKKNLEVTNNSNSYYYYSMDYAVGNVQVNSGKWYYEVKLLMSGQMQFGWCSASYHPTRGTGSYWGYDCSRQQKMSSSIGDADNKFGEYCSNGDILGCSLDMETKTIQYWRNGKDLGVAFSNVAPEPGGRLVPYIGLSRRVSVLFNFGREKFSHPQDGYNMLHCFLTEREISKLGQVFNLYKDISEKEAEQKDAMKDDENPQERIFGNGLLQLQKDLGATDEEDPIMLIISWKLNCKTVWEVSRSEFMNGFTINGCSSMSEITAKVKEWKEELRANDLQFKKFYNFVFDYLREDKTILGIDEATAVWNIVLKEQKWGLYQHWLDFLAAEKKKSISRDAWQQLWHFMQSFPNDLKEYDASSSWPIIFDDFVDWMKAKEKGKK